MPTVTDQHLTLYDIKVNGVAIDPEIGASISEIRVVDYLALPDLCTFTVGFESGEETSETKPIDKHPFPIGAELVVSLSEREELQTHVVFEGQIVTLEPQFSSGGAELTVRAFDRSHLLNRSRKVRTFQQVTASDIVKKIVGEHGLSPQVDATRTTFKFMQQDNETDLDFIWRLANRIGFEFFVDGTKATFRKVGSGTPIELEWPVELHDFRSRLTGVQQVSEVTVRAWDPKNKQTLIGKASSPRQTASIGVPRSKVTDLKGPASIMIPTEPTADQAEADTLAQAMLDRLANAYVSADGTCFGNPKIRAGQMVKIKGVGKNFGGTYRVQSSHHTLQGGSAYMTEFSSTAVQTITGAVGAGRPQEWAGQLVIGLVTNNQDPDKMGRVRVKYPSLDDQQEGWWARVLVPHAGANRGLMMLPKVGDEVLVAFEHADTTRPFVLGSLYNGRDKPPKDFADPDGSLAIASDKHVIVSSKEEMRFTSNGDLTLKVAGKGQATMTYDQSLKVDAKMNIDLKAGTQLTIKGGMISVQSNGPLEIKGNPVTIDGGAMVSIKGALVNLG
jgi:phage protein D/phage baseplate assembly protein gpV